MSWLVLKALKRCVCHMIHIIICTELTPPREFTDMIYSLAYMLSFGKLMAERVSMTYRVSAVSSILSNHETLLDEK